MTRFHEPTPVSALSSRRQTQLTGVFTRETPGIRSLERGLGLLRAFRPGISTLTNGELAQRTGLPRPTVSRLTRTLVDAGFLDFDSETGTYRLGAPFLSFGNSVRQASTVLEHALLYMRELAEHANVNIGLAVADDGEMVYLESVRRSRAGLFRRIVSGSRVPIELTALGRAWLAGSEDSVRQSRLTLISRRYGDRWTAVEQEVDRGILAVLQAGYCSAIWQAGMLSIAAPLTIPGLPVHSVNISFSRADGELQALEDAYAPQLLRLVDRIKVAVVERRSSR